jgi:hypothetical protein
MTLFVGLEVCTVETGPKQHTAYQKHGGRKKSNLTRYTSKYIKLKINKVSESQKGRKLKNLVNNKTKKRYMRPLLSKKTKQNAINLKRESKSLKINKKKNSSKHDGM